MFAGGGWNPAVVFISRDEKEMTLVVGKELERSG
jgi:hypothetical protein